jgi:hypothetical protein
LAPANRGALNSTHIYGTRVPVEEPSTASRTDSCSAKAASYSISRQAIGLYAVYPSTRNLSAKARVFIDLLIERFGDDPF